MLKVLLIIVGIIVLISIILFIWEFIKAPIIED